MSGFMKTENIPKFPGYYISKRGKLWKFRKGKWVRVKPHINPTRGYLYVFLRKEGKSYGKRLNRLVALVYCPNPDHLPIVMHLDNNIYNNHYRNLKWGTYKENSQQMIREGRGKGQFKPKLDLDTRIQILNLYDTGRYTLKELSDMYKCKNMSRVVRRTRNQVNGINLKIK